MSWEVEFTNEFEMWWVELDDSTQVAIDATLSELREFLGHTQSDVANNMGVVQSALSKIDHQDDIQISTLSRYIKSLGGSLTILARFPGQEVVISQFD